MLLSEYGFGRAVIAYAVTGSDKNTAGYQSGDQKALIETVLKKRAALDALCALL